MRSLDEVWEELFPGEQERVVEQLVDRLVVGLDHSDLHMRLHGIAGLASELRGRSTVNVQGDGSVASVRLHVAARRRCGRTRIRLHRDFDPELFRTVAACLMVGEAAC
jgi:hypothetical protein